MIHPNITHSRFVFGSVSWYAVLIVIGILLATLLGTKEEKRKGLPKDFLLDVILLAIPFGVIGARLYFVAFQLPYYSRHPAEIFALWEGGLAIYGAVIGGFFAVLLLCKKRKVSLAKTLDAMVPGLILAQAIGRWGNFFNMEAYGAQILNPSLQFFPVAVYIPNEGYFMATFFYEFVWNMMVFTLLWSKRECILHDGDTTLQYFGFYAAGRTFIEGLRSDSLYLFDIRVSQLLSVLVLTAVFLYLLHRILKKEGLKSFFWGIPLFFAVAVTGILLQIQIVSILFSGLFMCLIVLLRDLRSAKLGVVFALATVVASFMNAYQAALLCFMLGSSCALYALLEGEKE